MTGIQQNSWHGPKESDATSLTTNSDRFGSRLVVTTLNRSELNGIKLSIRSV